MLLCSMIKTGIDCKINQIEQEIFYDTAVAKRWIISLVNVGRKAPSSQQTQF